MDENMKGAAAPQVVADERYSSCLATIRDLDRISMKFAADLAGLPVVEGSRMRNVDYLARYSVLELVAAWRSAWDENSLQRMPINRAALQAAPVQAQEPRKPTDISQRLREYAGNSGYSHNDYADTMRVAADECERFYGGMVAWKENAQQKDRTIIDLRAKLAEAAPVQAQEPRKPTDISQRLRKWADERAIAAHYGDLMRTAADEIERYYGGMMAWKQTAEKKDADRNAERMARVDERIANRNSATVQPVAVPDGDPRPLFYRKLADLEQRGYEVIGRILHKDGQYALFDSSCRWLEKAQYQRLMHEQDGSLFAAPAAQGDAKEEEAAQIIEWLIAQGHIDWRSDGADENGHEDGFNSNDEEAATLRHYIGLARAAIAAKAAS